MNESYEILGSDLGVLFLLHPPTPLPYLNFTDEVVSLDGSVGSLLSFVSMTTIGSVLTDNGGVFRAISTASSVKRFESVLCRAGMHPIVTCTSKGPFYMNRTLCRSAKFQSVRKDSLLSLGVDK